MKLRSRRLRSPLLLALPLLLVAAALLSGCATSSGSDGNGKPRVLTTFTVVADMAREVGGDRVEVNSITKPGAEIHGYEPTPSDLKNAAGADLILWNGLGLERWFEQFIDTAGTESADLSEGINAIPIAGTGEYAGKPNPHAWMSIENAEIYVDNIVAALSRLDPAGEATFKRNGERYKAQIAKVGGQVKADLAELPESHRLLVSCEGAFSYLARDLNLREAYIWPVNTEQEGTPQEIAATVGTVEESGVPAVFCESTVNPKSMEQVAREAGSELGGTLYVDSLSAAGGPVPTYLELLRHDVETISAGLTEGVTSKPGSER